jgi:hypothetical protein
VVAALWLQTHTAMFGGAQTDGWKYFNVEL